MKVEKFALIGEKLGHSFSKPIHERYFELSGKNASYELYEIAKESFGAQMNNIKSVFDGINITIPYKVDAMEFADSISDAAKKIGAVNTILYSPDGVYAHNTDYFGIIHTFKRFSIEIKDRDIVILGTGGAARAVAVAVMDMGAKSIKAVSRTPKSFMDIEVIGYNDKLSGDVLINSTPVGMYPNADASPIDGEISFNAVFDLIYNPLQTKLMKMAASQGVKAVNGLYMLVSQAIHSEAIWHNEEVNEEIIDKIYGGML